MKSMGDRTLMIGALLVGLLIAAIVWFLAISPKLSSAQTAREATAAQEEQNDILELTLLKRQNSAENMPDYIREIYEIRDILPPVEDLPSVRRLINEIVADAGLVVEIERITPPTPIYGGLSLAPAMEEVGLQSEIEGMTFSTLLGTSYSLELEGPVTKILKVIDDLRTGEHRYILVTSLTFSMDKSGNPGDIRASIGATIFTLDYGNPAITVRPAERPWPGTEEEEAAEIPESIFDPIVEPTDV